MDEVLTTREKVLVVGVLLVSGFISSCMVGFGIGFMLGKLAA
jgi:F0F1-type ATP synthase assembly protein I